MNIGKIVDFLDSIAPPVYQESYDNSRLIVGNKQNDVSSALLCLDVTDAVVEDAIKKGCGLIISHHPLIFTGVKSITPSTWEGRAIINAIKNDIAIFSIHTNLDNVFNGVNKMIAEKLALKNCKILQPKTNTLNKFTVICPESDINKVNTVIKLVIEENKQHHDTILISGSVLSDTYGNAAKLEFSCPDNLKSAVLNQIQNLSHNINISYDLMKLDSPNNHIGSGFIGECTEMSEEQFLAHIAKNMDCKVIKHTALTGKPVKKVAVCGGSGSFLLKNAIMQGADIFVSADFKYHEYFEANNQILIADIGHYESEKFTQHLIQRYLKENFPNFAVYLTDVNTNPIKYITNG